MKKTQAQADVLPCCVDNQKGAQTLGPPDLRLKKKNTIIAKIN